MSHGILVNTFKSKKEVDAFSRNLADSVDSTFRSSYNHVQLILRLLGFTESVEHENIGSGGSRGELAANIFSISCSFREYLIKFYPGAPLSEGWHPPEKIPDPPLIGILGLDQMVKWLRGNVRDWKVRGPRGQIPLGGISYYWIILFSRDWVESTESTEYISI